MKSPRLLSPLCLIAFAASLAAAPLNRLARSAPEAQGVPASAVLAYVNAADAVVDSMHSFILVRHGKVVAEGWWAPYGAAEPHTLFSLSKSFTSTAVGLAIDQGKLGLSDAVVGFFPKEAPENPSANLKAMRVRDLLRMSSGQHGEDVDPFPFGTDQDLVRVFLSKPVAHKPGTHFFYNTAGTYMLAAIVQKATGQTVRDYLMPRLFEPLGIEDPVWATSAQGISLGGFGLSLRTEDIACFGQLYLQRGQWNGRQLVPAAWVDEATSVQTSNGSDPESNWDQGYGYQFWRCPHGFYRGDGAFGQLCIVMPGQDAVLAVTAGTKDMATEINLVWKHLLPSFAAAPLPEDAEADGLLAARLSRLCLPTVKGAARSAREAAAAGRRYVFPKNRLGYESIVLEAGRDGGVPTLVLGVGGSDQRVACGAGTWSRATLATPGTQAGFGDYTPVAASGAWTSEDTYTAYICHYRTPFVDTLSLTFSGDRVDLTQAVNLSLFAGGEPIRLVGSATP